MTDTELSPDERDALARLRREVLPPAGADARTIEALRSEGLLRSRRLSLFRWTAAAAVLVCAFAAGVRWDRSLTRTAAVRESRFILLLYGGDTDDRADRREEYAGWAHSVASRGVDITGEELSDSGDEIPPERPMGRRLAATSSWRPRARPRPGRSRRRALTCATVGELSSARSCRAHDGLVRRPGSGEMIVDRRGSRLAGHGQEERRAHADG